MTWRLEAACAGMSPARFHPVTDDGERDAKAVCAGCPSRDACLQHALNAGEPDGVWGGLSAQQRKELDRRRPVRYCVECDVRYHPGQMVGARVVTCSPECAATRVRRINRDKSARHRAGSA